MKKGKVLLVSIITACLLNGAAPYTTTPAFAAGSSPYVSPWPKSVDKNGVHVVVYQPQLKSWRNYRNLVADTAISITQSDGKPILGVISWRADTITNVSARTVFVRNIEVLNSRFPSPGST
jgi:hypothetical protein